MGVFHACKRFEICGGGVNEWGGFEEPWHFQSMRLRHHRHGDKLVDRSFFPMRIIFFSLRSLGQDQKADSVLPFHAGSSSGGPEDSHVRYVVGGEGGGDGEEEEVKVVCWKRENAEQWLYFVKHCWGLYGCHLKMGNPEAMYLSTRAVCIIALVEYQASACQMCLVRLRLYHKGIEPIKAGLLKSNLAMHFGFFGLNFYSHVNTRLSRSCTPFFPH